MELLVPFIALSAGAFSFFAPCRFLLLPSFLSRGLGRERSLANALMTAFLPSFGVFAVVLAAGFLILSFWSLVSQFLTPLLALGSLFISFLGASILLNFPIGVELSVDGKRKGSPNLVLFGANYALAIAGCSAPAFFTVAMYALASGTFSQGIFLFALYALGMSFMLAAAALATHFFGKSILEEIKRSSREIRLFTGFALILLGIYFFAKYSLSMLTPS